MLALIELRLRCGKRAEARKQKAEQENQWTKASEVSKADDETD